MPLDPDIKKMTFAQRGRELQRVRDLIRTHRDKKENARCWLNDVNLSNKTLPEGSLGIGKMSLPVPVLLANCKKYILGQKRVPKARCK